MGAGVALALLLAAGVAVLGWEDRIADRPGASNGTSAGGEADGRPGAGDVELRPDPGLDDLLADERAVEPGSAALVGPEDWSAADGSLGRTRPTCDVAGCALWRGTLLGDGALGRHLALGTRQAVAVRDRLLVAVDLDTGQPRWRVPRPLPERQVHALHLDERIIAVANGTTVTTLHPWTGEVRGTSAPLPAVVNRFARYDGQLIAFGTGPEGMLIAGLDERAQVRFVRTVRLDASLSSAPNDPLLVAEDGVLRRLDATTGTDHWSVPLDRVTKDGFTLLDRAEGRIEVLDPRSGDALLTRSVPGAVAAGVRSGVLVVVTPDRLTLVGRDGTTIGEVAGLDPTVSVVTAAGPRVTVVHVPSGGALPRVEVRQAPGAVSGLPGPADVFDIPGTDVFEGEFGRIGRELGATRRRDGLLVATDRDAWVVPPGRDVAVPVDVPLGERVRHVDGLSIRLLADGLELGGAGGRIGVRGAFEVLSSDPLLVRGPEGTLRLDRTLLDG
ncbi:MAG: PQQ-binding-like beta-propeller repeat protein [Nitriliruptoraceae bacterium]